MYQLKGLVFEKGIPDKSVRQVVWRIMFGLLSTEYVEGWGEEMAQRKEKYDQLCDVSITSDQ